MSLTTKAIGLAKKLKSHLSGPKVVYLSPVRRIERIKTNEKVCAMTFDDGPMAQPPSSGGDKSLTLTLLEILEKHGARGTFDIIGDTSGNYPDKPGKEGSAEWGGQKFDHYPDIFKDEEGGAVHCPELVQRIIDGGHELSNHTYSHLLFGRKNVVYGNRQHLNGVNEAIDDVKKLHDFVKDKFGYEMTLSRPPHYVDKIEGGFSSYDVYAALGYQYMAASYDGAGWLPLSTYEAEVEAMWKGMENDLSRDPDFFCGQIIFQKDGYNMARRTPVADGLEIQLELLKKHGYKIVSVSELLELSPFQDTGSDSPIFDNARFLVDKGYTICYRDNTLRIDEPLTRAELAMMIYGWQAAVERLSFAPTGFSDLKASHPYAGAVQLAVKNGALHSANGEVKPNDIVCGEEFRTFSNAVFGKCEINPPSELKHSDAIKLLSKLEAEKLRN